MGNAQSCVVCTDGAHVKRGLRWGIGLTFSLHADRLGLDGQPIDYFEDSWSGWSSDSKFFADGEEYSLWTLENDIAVAETVALSRAFWCVAAWVPSRIMPIIISDRVASLRSLEARNGKPIIAGPKSTDTKFRHACAHALRMLRVEVIRALRVHSVIRVFYHEDRGFDASWRPDALSRSGHDTCRIPSSVEDPYWVRINFNAENVERRINNSGMILEQVLRLE